MSRKVGGACGNTTRFVYKDASDEPAEGKPSEGPDSSDAGSGVVNGDALALVFDNVVCVGACGRTIEFENNDASAVSADGDPSDGPDASNCGKGGGGGNAAENAACGCATASGSNDTSKALAADVAGKNPNVEDPNMAVAAAILGEANCE